MISNPAAEYQQNRPMTCHRESSLKKNENRVHLGTNYIPGHNAVICGRGKACTASPGNKKLRAYIGSFAKSYGSATNKEQKSKIVSAIISLIEEPEGGAFVKFEESTWWKVDEAYAREKIGNLFRDVLHTKYRSSSKAKQARKHRVATGSLGFVDEIQSIVTKLSMDRSYSSCSSSSASTMLHMNNSNWTMDFAGSHGACRQSSVGIPSMPSMVFGMRGCYNNAIPPMSQLPIDRRGILLNYCNEALNITCTNPKLMSWAEIYHPNAADMGTFNSVVVPFTTSCENAVATTTPYKSSRSFDLKASTASSKVSEDRDGMEKDDDDDEVSIATFAEDDDIFSDFLVENVEELSRRLHGAPIGSKRTQGTFITL
ncbi:hypothetical protein IV203_007732 [Nitzschia inconspicua]|uniref:DUF6824 domain-containing protein n=1 Tax=Nitzschia inconspicua TaxID=303405 RepID=A0A9K3KYE8_9STRA|nr:hypothetical protein IV203_007732 [Nitzschia inconspicua]